MLPRRGRADMDGLAWARQGRQFEEARTLRYFFTSLIPHDLVLNRDEID